MNPFDASKPRGQAVQADNLRRLFSKINERIDPVTLLAPGLQAPVQGAAPGDQLVPAAQAARFDIVIDSDAVARVIV